MFIIKFKEEQGGQYHPRGQKPPSSRVQLCLGVLTVGIPSQKEGLEYIGCGDLQQGGSLQS